MERIKGTLGYRANRRKFVGAEDTFELREVITPFGNADNLNSGNTYLGNREPEFVIDHY